MDEASREYEAYLIGEIQRIQRLHEAAVKPFVEQLAKLRGRFPSVPLILSFDMDLLKSTSEKPPGGGRG